MSGATGCWFSQCFFLKGDKEILIKGSSEFYGIIGENFSIIYPQV